ncbi:reverse transcriptase domain-containing protein [Tanacetum coccineum]
MRTRSSGPVVEPSTTPRRRRNKKHSQQVDPTIVEKPVVTMADTRTMAELLQAPTEGYGDAIVIPAILAENFELKHGLLNLGAARIWLEKEPPRSIVTWEDLVSKLINQFFPPSKTTNLRNEITNFQQRFDESFCEAWERFKDLLRACPHHGFTELHQIDTFYNSLTLADQDSLNAAADGNLLTKTPKDALTLIENKSKALLLKNTTPSSDSVKAVEESCVTCGGPHPYYQSLATDGNVFPGYQDNIQAYVFAAAVNYNQGNAGHHPLSVAHQVRPPSFPPVQNNQNRGNNYTRRGVSYDGPPIPPPFDPRKLSLSELTPTQMILELADRSTTRPTGIVEDVFVRVGKFHFPADFVVVDYVVDPRVPLILGRPFLRTARALIDVDGGELTLRVSDEAITFKVGNTSRYSYNDVESINRIDVIDITCDGYSQEVLGFSNNSESGNPTSTSEPIIAKSSPSLIPFKGGDFILEEIEAYLASDSVPPGIDDAEFNPDGDIRLIEEMLNKDPYSPLPPKDLTGSPSFSGMMRSHLEEKERIIKVLKSHKQAIAWKLSDIKGIDP